MINIGISDSDFINIHYEKSFLYCPAAISAINFDWVALNEILLAWDPNDGQLKLFNHGQLPISAYTDCVQDVDSIRMSVSPQLLRSQMRAGATLVMDRLDRKSSLINNICVKFADICGEKTVANGYIAFGGKGTFGCHWDTHDVFAVQLMGRKRWKVYAPTHHLPLKGQGSSISGHTCPTEPLLDKVLEAGDVLYIPRGWWHEALPIENEETFHIAVGVHTAKMVDYCHWLCTEILGKHLEARKTFKIGENNSELLNGLADLISNEILKPVNYELFERRIAALKNSAVDRNILARDLYCQHTV